VADSAKAGSIVQPEGDIDQKLAALDRQIAAQRADLKSSTETPSTNEWWSTTNAMTMSAVVLFFGVLVLFMAYQLLKAGKSAEAVLRIFGTILIVFLAVFLVVAGYSNTQITPVMGLLGTVAGYLLGKDPRPQDRSQKTE
jgi:hypothetical protein